MSGDSQILGVRLPDDLRKKLKDYARQNSTTETAVVKSILQLHFSTDETQFMTYEGRYMKALMERSLYHLHTVIEHLRKTKDPVWDGKAYHQAAKTRAYQAEKDCDEQARPKKVESSNQKVKTLDGPGKRTVEKAEEDHDL
jgi:hypothetical protein